MAETKARTQIPEVNCPVKENSYIVKLKQTTDKEEHLKYVDTHIHHRVDGQCEITHPAWKPDFFNGYAGIFSGAALDALCHLSDIEYIEKDTVATPGSTVTQTNAPWGLARLSQNSRLVGNSSALNFTYRYDSSAGHGVDIYVLDTGVFIGHNDFGWRADWGPNFVTGSAITDVHGHGTHCAGTAIGTQFGVAKAARVISVKVLGDAGPGFLTDIIAGIEWSASSARASGRPSIMSISIQAGYSRALNDVATMATSWGVHVVACAGNHNSDASTISPASAVGVISVGASTINDARWSDSNFGPSVAIFAPGENVISCGISSPTSFVSMSGTSMATPHVAGLIAYLIARHGNTTPAAMRSWLQSIAVWNALSGLPSGTINALARNDQ